MSNEEALEVRKKAIFEQLDKIEENCRKIIDIIPVAKEKVSKVTSLTDGGEEYEAEADKIEKLLEEIYWEG